MSESWERTASTHPLKRKVKKQLIHLFHSGLVGGEPHRDYYISQGMPSDKLYIGYDVVDNQFFAEAKQRICLDEASVREKWCLPKSYFLSLGRFVAKKNLTTLIQAYSLLAHRIQNLSTHLVFVGSGEMEESLKETCRSSNLKFVDHRTKDLKLLKENQPYVHFFGFKQIHENPIFYSLATAFILPSEHEEWGLVVNEAMACSLPVIVSREAGCAKDLVHHGRNGFQFDPLNPRELSDYMEKFVHEPELKIKMGEESRILINRWSCELFAENAWKAIQAAMN